MWKAASKYDDLKEQYKTGNKTNRKIRQQERSEAVYNAAANHDMHKVYREMNNLAGTQ